MEESGHETMQQQDEENKRNPTVKRFRPNKCTCEPKSPDFNPLTTTCTLHKPNYECPDDYYEKLEKQKAEEYKNATDTHEKRMHYFRTEVMKYVEETEWMYKPIDHYLK